MTSRLERATTIVTLIAVEIADTALLARATAAENCPKQAQTLLLNSSTEALTSYLGRLYESKTIQKAHLLRLLEALDRDQITNPISEEDASSSTSLYIHRQGLDEIIKSKFIDLKKLKEWLKSTLDGVSRAQRKRETISGQTEIADHKIEFVEVPPGRFRFGSGFDVMKVTLTHTIDVMSTLVTQKQWVDVMGENPAHFAKGKHSVQITIRGESITLQPNNPIENITWWSALEYANRLSTTQGLAPAYDMSGLKFKPDTRAEDGTLAVESGELKINSPNGSIYKVSGYRLPTEVEQEYLLRGAGTSKNNFYFGDDTNELLNYAWFNKNSGQTTHPVAELRPLVINGKEIYDIMGNVKEFSQDQYVQIPPNATLTDPESRENGIIHRVARSGSWDSPSWGLDASHREGIDFNCRAKNIGFRLVRTLR